MLGRQVDPHIWMSLIITGRTTTEITGRTDSGTVHFGIFDRQGCTNMHLNDLGNFFVRISLPFLWNSRDENAPESTRMFREIFQEPETGDTRLPGWCDGRKFETASGITNFVKAGKPWAEAWFGPIAECRSWKPNIEVARSFSGRVVLYGPTESPIVDGKKVTPLRIKQYDVMLALVRAGEKGLTKTALADASWGGARGILNRLRKTSAAWSRVISFPGKTGGGYRVS